MLTLLQINAALNSGAPGRIVEQIGKLAENNGWISYAIHGCRYKNETSLKHFPVTNKLGEINHAIQTRLFDNHGLANKGATRQIIKKIEAINPDIIHIHNLHGYYINYQVLFEYLNKINVPIVWTLHDCWPFTGHCAYFSYNNCEKWKSQCCDCPLKQSYPSSFVDNSRRNFAIKKELFTSVKNLTLVPVSIWLENLVKESFFRDHENVKIKMIHNGIDLSVFKPDVNNSLELKEELGLMNKFVIMGCANQFTKMKGYEDFKKLRSILDSTYAIVLIGISSSQRKELERQGIIGIERTENISKLVAFYSLADVFINPTYNDNYPTTNLEAIACGTPIITYRTGGSVEAADSICGYIVGQGDICGLKTQIEYIKKKGKTYYCNLCREKAIAEFDKDACFGKYIELYSHLILESGRARAQE